MKYCPYCGTPLPAHGAVCPGCGGALEPAAPEAPAGSVSRGLRIAIIAVASLCVLTVALWIAWPYLASAVPAEPSPAQNVGAIMGLRSSPAPAEPSAEPTAAPTEEPQEQDMKLELDTWWWGYAFFSDYKSSDGRQREDMEVWAYFGTDKANGRPYFEIYDKEDASEAEALFSAYIELYDDHYVPVIGYHDAWILDKYLDSGEAEALTVYLEGNSLWFMYPYDFDGESCTLSFLLVPDA